MSDQGTAARDDGVVDAGGADGRHDDAAGSDGADDASDGAGDPPGPPGVEGEADTLEVSGRPYLLGAAGVVTLFAAAAGYVVAANNSVGDVTVFGLLTLPGSAPAMALYGAALSLSVLGGLFGLVSVASRFDDDAMR